MSELPRPTLPQENREQIVRLEGKYDILDTKLVNLHQLVFEMKNNDLHEIKADIKRTIDKIDTLKDKLTEDISKLKQTDSERKPAFNLGTKAIDYIVMAVIAGVIAMWVKGGV